MLRSLMRFLNNPKESAWKPVSWDTENQPGKMPETRLWGWINPPLGYGSSWFFHLYFLP